MRRGFLQRCRGADDAVDGRAVFFGALDDGAGAEGGAFRLLLFWQEGGAGVTWRKL
jgi:hypothetical protein